MNFIMHGVAALDRPDGRRLSIGCVLSLLLLFVLYRSAFAFPQAYLDAVDDAEDPQPSKIYLLSPVRADNGQVTWRGTPGSSELLVVTWTAASYYDNAVGEYYTLPSSAEVWVTLSPELKRFYAARKLSPESVPARIEQVLGLPPDRGKNRFVEFWVDMAEIFRPSKDAEIDDTYAQLTFPAGTSSAHITWFNKTLGSIYSGSAPMPWTQLGYTYDWGSNNHQGLSEYIIRGGSTIFVKGIFSNEEYFQPAVDFGLQWAALLALALMLAGLGVLMVGRRSKS